MDGPPGGLLPGVLRCSGRLQHAILSAGQPGGRSDDGHHRYFHGERRGTRAGCRLAYLQVEESNKTGRSVYGKLGFTEAYRYHYRTEPEEDAQ